MNYSEYISSIHQTLGIPADYAASRQMTLIPEATHLIQADMNSAGRPRCLTPTATRAWHELKAAAAAVAECDRLAARIERVENDLACARADLVAARNSSRRR